MNTARCYAEGEMWKMERICWMWSLLLTGLLVLSLPLSNASAVTIDLRPDGPTTIGVGETVNVDVFILLDPDDRGVGIGAVTLWLELGQDFVSVDPTVPDFPRAFPSASVGKNPTLDVIAFSEFGATVTDPEALLGTLAITGVNPGSYDLVTRVLGPSPLFTAPGTTTPNRWDGSLDHVVPITVAAVPEAGTLVLLGASLAGLAFLRRRSV